MGASEKKTLPKNCPTAQQFTDFFEANTAAVQKATGGGDVTTELSPATETFDRFQPCSVTDVKIAIMGLLPSHVSSTPFRQIFSISFFRSCCLL